MEQLRHDTYRCRHYGQAASLHFIEFLGKAIAAERRIAQIDDTYIQGAKKQGGFVVGKHAQIVHAGMARWRQGSIDWTREHQMQLRHVHMHGLPSGIKVTYTPFSQKSTRCTD